MEDKISISELVETFTRLALKAENDLNRGIYKTTKADRKAKLHLYRSTIFYLSNIAKRSF